MRDIKVIESRSLKVVAHYTENQYPEVFDDGANFKVYANGTFSKEYPCAHYHYEINEKENES